MDVISLNRLESGTSLYADLLIVGGGPVGLTIARECIGAPLSVLVIESGGLEEDPAYTSLNKVERAEVGDAERRTSVHQDYAPSWSHDEQPYGVRCRILGGSSHLWAGKSAAFDGVDFEQRSWVPFSGWPMARSHLEPFIERAADVLNLGPNVYDDDLWSVIGSPPPGPVFDERSLRAFFWQFSRSRFDQFEAMRFGPDFLRETASNVRVLTNATVTEIRTNETVTRFQGVRVASLSGRTANIGGRAAVLAASAIENPRLLLASRQHRTNGLGNDHNMVGRFLMDHPAAHLAGFAADAAPLIARRFGFQGVPYRGQMHMYMHGLAIPQSRQQEEGLLNCALFMLEEHALDDPLIALKRLVKRRSKSFLSDLTSVLRSPAPVAKGVGIKAFQSRRMPERLKRALISAVVRWNPNLAVRETLHRGVQYKRLGMRVEGITEQVPDPDNRISLSDACDPLGVPRPRVVWRVDTLARRTLGFLGQSFASECERTGLPRPIMPDWIVSGRFDEAPVVDMAHSMGTTRMSEDPKQGVVDAKCRVHGISGLFVSGGSVFPTGGHANPTLMMLALAVRLADDLKRDLARRRAD